MASFALYVTDDPRRFFCVEDRKYVSFDEIFEPGSHFPVTIQFQDGSVFEDAEIWIVNVMSPFFKPLDYQPMAGDHFNMATPCFDSIVSEASRPRLFALIGESFCYLDLVNGHAPVRSTTFLCADTENALEAAGLIDAFLWNYAPWSMPLGFFANQNTPDHVVFEPSETITLDFRTRFASEKPAIMAKALEAWWLMRDLSTV